MSAIILSLLYKKGLPRKKIITITIVFYENNNDGKVYQDFEKKLKEEEELVLNMQDYDKLQNIMDNSIKKIDIRNDTFYEPIIYKVLLNDESRNTVFENIKRYYQEKIED